MDRRFHRAAVLGAEVSLIDVELRRDSCGGAHPRVEFFEDVVVDQGKLDVLVPAPLAGFGVNFSEKIQRRALGRETRIGGCGVDAGGLR